MSPLSTLAARAEYRESPNSLVTVAPRFGTVERFVSGFLVRVYARQVRDNAEMSWCPRWWSHPEAVERLTALWRAYKHLHAVEDVDGLAASDWWLSHADPHMHRLLDPAGPFKYCSPVAGHRDALEPLPVEPMPDNARDQ